MISNAYNFLPCRDTGLYYAACHTCLIFIFKFQQQHSRFSKHSNQQKILHEFLAQVGNSQYDNLMLNAE